MVTSPHWRNLCHGGVGEWLFPWQWAGCSSRWPKCNCFAYEVPVTYAKQDSVTNAHALPNADPHAHPVAYAVGHPNADAFTYADADALADSDTNRYAGTPGIGQRQLRQPD